MEWLEWSKENLTTEAYQELMHQAMEMLEQIKSEGKHPFTTTYIDKPKGIKETTVYGLEN